MTHKNSIALLLILLCSISYGQTIKSVDFDSTICDGNTYLLDLKDKKVLNAIADGAKYIQAIVGKKNFQEHVKINYCASRLSGFQIYGTDIKNPQRNGEGICYELYYLVVDKTDTLGDFQLAIGINGKLIKTQTYEDFNSHPELIYGFKKVLDKNFKTDYRQSLRIATQNGYKSKPYLSTETDNYFSTIDNKTFVKVKYYWIFSEFLESRGYATLKINAETGIVESKQIVPAMPR